LRWGGSTVTIRRGGWRLGVCTLWFIDEREGLEYCVDENLFECLSKLGNFVLSDVSLLFSLLFIL
jgi:hypothetical protein